MGLFGSVIALLTSGKNKKICDGLLLWKTVKENRAEKLGLFFFWEWFLLLLFGCLEMYFFWSDSCYVLFGCLENVNKEMKLRFFWNTSFSLFGIKEI